MAGDEVGAFPTTQPALDLNLNPSSERSMKPSASLPRVRDWFVAKVCFANGK